MLRANLQDTVLPEETLYKVLHLHSSLFTIPSPLSPSPLTPHPSQCVLSLGFSELRMRNSEQDLFERWGQEHPCERLLEIGEE